MQLNTDLVGVKNVRSRADIHLLRLNQQSNNPDSTQTHL